MCRNWSRGVDYNRRKPKDERGMLMEVQKIEVLGGEYYDVALRGLGRSYSPLFKYSGGLGNICFFRESPIITPDANEDIRYRTAKCNIDMNLVINETNETRKFSFNISIRWNISEIIERTVWNHCSE